ncbi:MAG TPA: DUF3617 family protein [Thermoanaerobaculia bacterium]|nr:DUF3617 family protein [Thermoanaerobaculia bacterium]
MRTSKTAAAAVVSFAMLLTAATALAAVRVQPGQWQTSMTTGAGKPVVTSHCITPAEAALMNGDVAGLRKYVEQSTAKNTRGRCSVRDVTVSDNRTTVTIACGTRVVVGTTTYHGDHYESTSSNGTKLVGKRLGACP